MDSTLLYLERVAGLEGLYSKPGGLTGSGLSRSGARKPEDVSTSHVLDLV